MDLFHLQSIQVHATVLIISVPAVIVLILSFDFIDVIFNLVYFWTFYGFKVVLIRPVTFKHFESLALINMQEALK
jgi:hypothetical protein